MAFSLDERQHMGIHGLLPPAILSQDIQALRAMINFHRAQGSVVVRGRHCPSLRLTLDDLDRYNELMNLSERNEKLFYRVIAGWLSSTG